MNSFLAHFFPRKEEKKRAKLLSHPVLIVYIVFILGAIFSTNFISYKFPNVLGFASNINTNDLLYYTNQARSENGESALKLNSRLSEAAYEKAQNMFNEDYWAHVSPSGKEPWDFIVSSGYEYIYAGENLARDFNNSDSVVGAWLNSPTHRDNLLSANYEDIGFAVVNGVLDGHETTLVVQMFGKSRYPEYTASIEQGGVSTVEEAPVREATVAVSEIEKKEVAPIVEKQFVEGNPAGEVLPALDIFNTSRGISLSLGAFLTLLLSLDIWYVKRNRVLQLTGNTVTHLLFLILALIGVWYANAGIVL